MLNPAVLMFHNNPILNATELCAPLLLQNGNCPAKVIILLPQSVDHDSGKSDYTVYDVVKLHRLLADIKLPIGWQV